MAMESSLLYWLSWLARVAVTRSFWPHWARHAAVRPGGAGPPPPAPLRTVMVTVWPPCTAE